MSKGNSFGDLTGTFQRLLVAVEENKDRLPDVQAEKAALEKSLADAQEAKKRQDLHVSDKQRATQDLAAALARGKDAAIQLRGAAKFKLGPRDEKLVHFQVAPLRKRGARKTALKQTPVKQPEAPQREVKTPEKA